MKTKAEILKRQQEILNFAKGERRDLNVEERREFDDLQKQLEALIRAEEEESQAVGENTNRAAGETQADPALVAQRAIEQERKRVADITELCRSFDLSPEGYIAAGNNLESVRTAVLEKLQKGSAPINVRVAVDEGDKFRERAADALTMRSGITIEKPAEGSEQMRGMSLRDLAVECLAREGVGDALSLMRMNGSELYDTLSRQFYNPTAAFPAILDQTIRKSVVTLYNQVPTTFQAWTSKGSLSDFKSNPDHQYVIGGTGDFLLVPENGELKASAPKTEKLPNRKLDTYGKQFSMSRQAFINDDIGILTEIPGLYATGAKKTIDKMVYSVLYKNDPIFDGTALFHNNHKNLIAAGVAPSQAAIQQIILKMQRQVDQFGEAITIVPQYIVVPVGYEFDLAVILHSTQVTGSGNNDINPLYNYPLTIVQTPILNSLAGANACPWFMVANQMSAKSIQVDYLNGNETPIIRRMETPGTLGFVWDIYLDWGITFIAILMQISFRPSA